MHNEKKQQNLVPMRSTTMLIHIITSNSSSITSSLQYTPDFPNAINFGFYNSRNMMKSFRSLLYLQPNTQNKKFCKTSSSKISLLFQAILSLVCFQSLASSAACMHLKKETSILLFRCWRCSQQVSYLLVINFQNTNR